MWPALVSKDAADEGGQDEASPLILVFADPEEHTVKRVAMYACLLTSCTLPRHDPGTHQSSPSPRSSCPPESRNALPSYDGAFTLPRDCTSRCQAGIDTVDARLSCGPEEITYTAWFEGTVVPTILPSGAGMDGKESSPDKLLYWGRSSDLERCVVLMLNLKGNRLYHQFCADRAGSYDTMLAIARTWDERAVVEANGMCPYCG
jgi:hypothetical protein